MANKTKNMLKTSDQSPPQPLALVSVRYDCRSFSDFAAYAQSLDLDFYQPLSLEKAQCIDDWGPSGCTLFKRHAPELIGQWRIYAFRFAYTGNGTGRVLRENGSAAFTSRFESERSGRIRRRTILNKLAPIDLSTMATSSTVYFVSGSNRGIGQCSVVQPMHSVVLT